MRIMRNRKPISFVLVLCLLLSMAPMAAYADVLPTSSSQDGTQPIETQTVEKGEIAFSDMSGHWASAAVSKWASLGVIKGDVRGFRPDDPISRAEMAVILDNLMGYQTAASNTFQDLNGNEWYASAILKANAAGVLDGDGRGHANPTQNITREQAAVMLGRAFGVDAGNGSKTSFKDAGAISDWAKNLVFGMEEDKYIGGMGDGSFSPNSNITRAQVVTMLDNAVAGYYTSPGYYSDNILPKVFGGNCAVIVRTSGVIIKGSNINGDLIIAKGVAQGEFTLNGANVSGKMVVRGGGENSIEIINGAEVNGSVSIEKVGGKIRIVSNGKTIKELEADSEVILEGNFSNVSVAEGAAVEVRGQIENISVQAKADVAISKDAKVGSLSVEKTAEGAKIEISGTVTSLKTDAPKTDIIAKSTAAITNIEAASSAVGSNIDIDGKASVNMIKSDAAITKTGDGTAKTVTGSVKEQAGSGGGGGGGAPDPGETPQPDTTKPILTTGTAARLSSTGASVRFSSNEAGRYYYAIVDHNAAAPSIVTTGAGTSSAASEITVNLVISGGSKDVYIQVKDAAGNISAAVKIVIPDYAVANQYGLINAYEPANIFDNVKAKLITTTGATKTYCFADNFDVEVAKGQIIFFGLNDSNQIGAITTKGAVSVNSGLNIKSPSVIKIGDNLYDISDGVVVYAYKGVSPGATLNVYNTYSIDNITYNQPLTSPASVYLDSNSRVGALLVPISAIKVFAPTGLKGVAPSSASNNDGKITGVNSTMEYKASGATGYIGITGTVAAGLAAGTYLVRYKAVGSNPAGPTTTVIVPAYVAANQYGLIKDYESASSFDNVKVKLITADGATKTYYFADNFDAAVAKGQIIFFGLNDSNQIGAITTKGAVSVNSGLNIKSPSGLKISDNLYDISDDVVVYAYTGVSPGAVTNVYNTYSIDNIKYNQLLTSPACVYLDENLIVDALLVPVSAIKVLAPTGLNGIVPSSASNNDGKAAVLLVWKRVFKPLEYSLETHK